jgi:hypothetical protein
MMDGVYVGSVISSMWGTIGVNCISGKGGKYLGGVCEDGSLEMTRNQNRKCDPELQ